MNSHGRSRGLIVLAAAMAVVGLLATPASAEAYIGPGAGFAFVSSFFVSVMTGLLALFSLVMWPVRAIARHLRRRPRGRSKAGRLIVLVFNNQRPDATDRLVAQGKLVNLRRVVERGNCARLQSTRAVSPAMTWSAFSTGAMRATNTLTPFWIELSRYGIWSTILNVPAPLPARGFHGVQLGSSQRQAAPPSQPASYAWYLSKRVGAWGTLDRDGEQQAIYRTAIERFRSGVLVSVFDADELSERHDVLIGETLDGLSRDDVLIVMLGCGVSSDGRGEVPGFLISNRAFGSAAPSCVDIAPTALDLFGISPVAGMEGRPLFQTDALERIAS